MNPIPSRSSISSNNSNVNESNNDPCSKNTRYTTIYSDIKYNGIKPSTYCRIDKNTKTKFLCRRDGNNAYKHVCKPLPTPYIEDKPKFFSMFSSSNKGGRKSYKIKNKKNTKKGNNKKTRKTRKMRKK
jgi:hypothetical protein